MVARSAVEKQRTVDDRLTSLERNMGRARGRRQGFIEYATLDPNYMGIAARGRARVRIMGGDGTLTDPLEWATQYRPQGSRTVKIGWTGSQRIILGQEGTVTTPTGVKSGEYPLLPNQSANSWSYHEAMVDTTWAPPKATVLGTGLVVLSGLLRKIGSTAPDQVIATIPPEIAPETTIIVPVLVNNVTRGANINPSGTITARPGWPSDTYVSLENVRWWLPGVAQWQPISPSGSSDPLRFGPGFDRNPAWDGYGVPSLWTDPYGWVWGQGLVQNVSAVSTDGIQMVVTPSSVLGSLYQHITTIASDGFGMVAFSTSGAIEWKNASTATAAGAWTSLSGFVGVTPQAMSGNRWKTIAFGANNWNLQYGGPYPPASYCRREDGAVFLRGLMGRGNIGQHIFQVEQEAMPDMGRRILTAGYSGGAARWDLYDQFAGSDQGSLVMNVGPDTAGTWCTMDNLVYVP